jgi:hypothetical protein
MKELTSGGFITDQEVSLLVPVEQFGENAMPQEQEKISLYINEHGVPCAKDDADDAEPTVTMRVKRISRSGGALTYTLGSDRR